MIRTWGERCQDAGSAGGHLTSEDDIQREMQNEIHDLRTETRNLQQEVDRLRALCHRAAIWIEEESSAKSLSEA